MCCRIKIVDFANRYNFRLLSLSVTTRLSPFDLNNFQRDTRELCLERHLNFKSLRALTGDFFIENRRTTIPALRSPEDTDVTTWELPEGAIGRLGQGALLGVEYSSDGTYLAVATKMGFWIYDTATMTPRALWGTERGMFNVATFSHDRVPLFLTMIKHASGLTAPF